MPAGSLLGFMRLWRTSPVTVPPETTRTKPVRTLDFKQHELTEQISGAPTANRQFYAADLCRVIGQAAYEGRVVDLVRRFGCPRFTATLAVHGQAVLASEITR